MKRNMEFSATELAILMIAMNSEETRTKNHDSPAHKKAVTELRDKIAREYLAAEGRTESLLQVAITSERTGFKKPEWWLREAEVACGNL